MPRRHPLPAPRTLITQDTNALSVFTFSHAYYSNNIHLYSCPNSYHIITNTESTILSHIFSIVQRVIYIET